MKELTCMLRSTIPRLDFFAAHIGRSSHYATAPPVVFIFKCGKCEQSAFVPMKIPTRWAFFIDQLTTLRGCCLVKNNDDRVALICWAVWGSSNTLAYGRRRCAAVTESTSTADVIERRSFDGGFGDQQICLLLAPCRRRNVPGGNSPICPAYIL